MNTPTRKDRSKQEATKRALGVSGVIALTLLIRYLDITKQQTQERADRLSQALQDAEARLKLGL